MQAGSADQFRGCPAPRQGRKGKRPSQRQQAAEVPDGDGDFDLLDADQDVDLDRVDAETDVGALSVSFALNGGVYVVVWV